MKFQFCGNINCPEWFIAEISVLTKITAVKIKLIFTQLILHYLENADITPKVSKLLNGTGLDIYEMHSVIATLKFILDNSITFNISDLTLNKQLIDLGLPKCNRLIKQENVESIAKTYKSSRDKLSQKSLQNVLKTTDNIEVDYSVHELLASSKTGNLKNINVRKPMFAEVQLRYQDCINGETKRENFIVDNQQLDYLIYEVENGLETIQRLEKLQNSRNQPQESA